MALLNEHVTALHAAEPALLLELFQVVSRITAMTACRDRASLTQRQVRLDQGPLLVSEVSTRHGEGLPGRYPERRQSL
ncbi:hypothetical protein AB0392_06895 [Nonomuraea angiospora]|uniref:hypothetical protein n=1 Tax=Nonomuraea angiospora TaxID=46172 RepID=UPI003450E9D8